MNPEEKMALLADLYILYGDKPAWRSFFLYNNVGLPLAYLMHSGVVDLIDERKIEYVLETYELLCKFLNVSPDEDYDSLNEMILDSPRMS